MRVGIDKMMEHIKYEIDMYRWAASEVVKPLPLYQRNAMVEVFATHVRNLIDFFYLDRVGHDDAVAEHFVNNWRKIRPIMPDILKEAKVKANKQLAHITYSRAVEYGVTKEKGWFVGKISSKLEELIKNFAEEVEKAKK